MTESRTAAAVLAVLGVLLLIAPAFPASQHGAGQQEEIRADIPEDVPDWAISMAPKQTVNIRLVNLSDELAQSVPATRISVEAPIDRQVVVSPGFADSPTMEVNITETAILELTNMSAAPTEDAFYAKIHELLENDHITYRTHSVTTALVMDLFETVIAVQVSE